MLYLSHRGKKKYFSGGLSMDILVYIIAIMLGIMVAGHKRSTKGSGYTLLQTLFFAFAEKE